MDRGPESAQPPRHRYIAVEGPIGVGKTALVNLLARKFSVTPILEVPEENPFLSRFYGDMSRHAFQTQLFFLLGRYRQQMALAQQSLFREVIICDYVFAKDKIFAYLTLDDQELALYDQVYRLLQARVPKPDVVVYLQADTDVLLERIKLRGRDFEKGVSRQYIQELNDAYNYYFFHYRETPLLVINTTGIDFVKNDGELEDLARQIMRMRGGVEYYTPMRSR